MYKLEIACFNVTSARIAQTSGAHRVELCTRRDLGGITPPENDVIEARKALHIELNTMIRPRGGNFVYTPAEFEQMRAEITRFKERGVDGFVFGILHPDKTIQVSQNRELVELAYPIPCTFHRAFDQVADSKQALEDIISCGFRTVLTSGGQETAILGKAVLKQLVHWSANRITIMPGGGVRSTNIRELILETQATYYHSSAITQATGENAEAPEVKKMLTAMEV